MTEVLTSEGFADQFRDFRRAFRLEARDSYFLGYERAEYEHFLADEPHPPSEVPWWQDYLARVTGWAAEGRELARVRLDGEDPSPYQLWLAWCEPWHIKAGDNITHLPRSLAVRLGIPLYDFWLFDDERLVLMLFDRRGGLTGRILITDADAPDLVGQHIAWRDLAVRNATAAAPTAA
jgi:hypothetical protein